MNNICTTMEKNNLNQTLMVLENMFPQHKARLIDTYMQDAMFREISDEYYEIFSNMESNDPDSGEHPESYIDTLNELREELKDYLDKLK